MKNDALFKDMLRQKPGLKASMEKNRFRAELAERLVMMRKRAGLTQVALAERLGWSQPQVSVIEKATGPFPDPVRVSAYALACGAVAENTWTFTLSETERYQVAM